MCSVWTQLTYDKHATSRVGRSLRSKRLLVALQEDAKKKARAERFGLPVAKEAANKQGSAAPAAATAASKEAEEAKRKARAERFNLPAAAAGEKASKGGAAAKAAEGVAAVQKKRCLHWITCCLKKIWS